MTAIRPSRDEIEDALHNPTVIDQRAATALLLAVARVHADKPAFVKDDALAATVAIAVSA